MDVAPLMFNFLNAQKFKSHYDCCVYGQNPKFFFCPPCSYSCQIPLFPPSFFSLNKILAVKIYFNSIFIYLFIFKHSTHSEKLINYFFQSKRKLRICKGDFLLLKNKIIFFNFKFLLALLNFLYIKFITILYIKISTEIKK